MLLAIIIDIVCVYFNSAPSLYVDRYGCLCGISKMLLSSFFSAFLYYIFHLLCGEVNPICKLVRNFSKNSFMRTNEVRIIWYIYFLYCHLWHNSPCLFRRGYFEAEANDGWFFSFLRLAYVYFFDGDGVIIINDIHITLYI